jgi:hypothetical protein
VGGRCSRCLGPSPRTGSCFRAPPLLTARPRVKPPVNPPSFGVVEEVNIFKERRSHASKGCGFVLMASRAAARAAIEALNEAHVMVGARGGGAGSWDGGIA